MKPTEILGNQEEKKVIDDLLKQAGKDNLINRVIEGKGEGTPIRGSSLGNIVGLKVIAKRYDSANRHINDLAFSPDNKWLLVGEDTTTFMAEFDGSKLGNEDLVILQETHSVAFSKCGRYIATGGKKEDDEKYEITVFDTKTHSILGSGYRQGVIVNKVRFSPDDRCIGAIVGKDTEYATRFTACRFHKRKTHDYLEEMRDEFFITNFEFYPDGKHIAAVWDKEDVLSLRVYKFNKGILKFSSEAKPFYPASKLLLSPDGKHLVFAFKDKSTSKDKLMVLDGPSMKYSRLASKDYDSEIHDFAHDPCSYSVVAALGNNLEVYNYGEQVYHDKPRDIRKPDIAEPPLDYQAKKLVFSPDGNYIAAVCDDGCVRIMGVVRREK